MHLSEQILAFSLFWQWILQISDKIICRYLQIKYKFDGSDLDGIGCCWIKLDVSRHAPTYHTSQIS